MRYDVRPEVAAFALLMEQKLRENDHKGGWRDCSAHWLLGRLRQETQELASLMDLARGGESLRKAVAEEAADVANFAMMIADVCGALEPAPSGATETEGR